MIWRGIALFALAGCRLHFSEGGDDAGITAGDVSRDARFDCAQPGVIVCDDFTTMPTVLISGAVQWFASGGHSGGAMQEVGMPGGGPGIHWPLPSTTDGSLNVRTYLRVESGAPIGTFLVMMELNNAMATMGQEKVSADLSTADNWSIGAPFSGGTVSTTAAPRDRWLCVELRVVVSATAGEMHLLVDGTEVSANTGVNTLIPSGFQELILSATLSNTDPATIVDFDDLVVATIPIGC